jgi:hypothetical protein
MRRDSGKDILLITALGIAILTTLGATALAQNAVDVKPSPQQTQWQDLEFGVILHFGTNNSSTESGEMGRPIQRSSTRRSSTRISG